MKVSSCILPFLAASLLLSGCQTAGSLFSLTRDFAVGIYQATARQIQVADQRGAGFFRRLSPEQKKELSASGSRYLAVRTDDPTPAQWTKIRNDMRKPASKYQAGAAAPSKVYCVMIWDTQTQQIVGTDCYAVLSLPAVGGVARFDAYTAQYVGMP
jgi:hypothetical protein